MQGKIGSVNKNATHYANKINIIPNLITFLKISKYKKFLGEDMAD